MRDSIAVFRIQKQVGYTFFKFLYIRKFILHSKFLILSGLETLEVNASIIILVVDLIIICSLI